MARGIARTTLVGNLTRDPELKMLSGENAVCNLGVAVNLPHKVNGEWEEKGHFFDVTVWGKQGENAARYLEKGSHVAIDGHLEYQTWEKEGEKRSKVVVVAENVVFLDGKKEDGKNSTAPW